MCLILHVHHGKEKYLEGWIVEVLNLNIQHPPSDHYRRIYIEALDLTVTSIQSRFEQPGY